MNQTSTRISQPAQQGFSLVELSIVLVILGLLVGGVLSGQSLIRAAELRSVSTDVQRYKTATLAFRDKYFQLPGDMNNAVRFWGAQAGGTADGFDATCAALTTAATGTATCNGNGNGNVGDSAGSAASLVETFRFWQHLANAGLIEGSYSGIAGSGSFFENIPNTNVPKLRIGSTVGVEAAGIGSNPWGTIMNNYLRFGGYTAGSYLYGGFLKGEELWNIDTKLDDGRPSSGNINAPNATFAFQCVTTDVAATAAYDLQNTVKACIFITQL